MKTFEFPLSMRCQFNMGGVYQCVLCDGHDGEHQNSLQFEHERQRRLRPTLDDIRQVMREEIERALGKRSNSSGNP